MDQQLKTDLNRFANLTYEDFQKLANDPNLSIYQRIGFPNEYRKGVEQHILSDLISKLTNLNNRKATVIDIGCGCSELPRMLMQHCFDRNQALTLIDSKEMLNHIPDDARMTKIPGRFPQLPDFQTRMCGQADVILVYSVFHYVFEHGNMIPFLDASVRLLAPGGQLLIGDIPNVSKRKRFFASEAGVRFHQKFMDTTESPKIDLFSIEEGKIDDSILMSVILRYRGFGFETYLLPQSKNLPMENRREDLLIIRN